LLAQLLTQEKSTVIALVIVASVFLEKSSLFGS
jgi:hypothetical protein